MCCEHLVGGKALIVRTGVVCVLPHSPLSLTRLDPWWAGGSRECTDTECSRLVRPFAAVPWWHRLPLSKTRLGLGFELPHANGTNTRDAAGLLR